MKVIELIRHYDRTMTASNRMNYRLQRKIVQMMDVFGDIKVGSVGAVYAERANQRWAGKAPATIARQLAQLRAVFNTAWRDGLIQTPPSIRMPFVSNVRNCPLTPAQVQVVVSAVKIVSPRQHWPFIVVLLNTGARLSEALRLRDSDFTDRGTIIRQHVGRRAKTIERTVPYTKAMEALRAEGLLTNLVPRFMPHHVQGEDASPATAGTASHDLCTLLASVCDQLGMERIRVHDLRHAFAALIAERGGDVGDIASLLGHTNLQTTMRYRGLVTAKAKALLSGV